MNVLEECAAAAAAAVSANAGIVPIHLLGPIGGLAVVRARLRRTDHRTQPRDGVNHLCRNSQNCTDSLYRAQTHDYVDYWFDNATDHSTQPKCSNSLNHDEYLYLGDSMCLRNHCLDSRSQFH